MAYIAKCVTSSVRFGSAGRPESCRLANGEVSNGVKMLSANPISATAGVLVGRELSLCSEALAAVA